MQRRRPRRACPSCPDAELCTMHAGPSESFWHMPSVRCTAAGGCRAHGHRGAPSCAHARPRPAPARPGRGGRRRRGGRRGGGGGGGSSGGGRRGARQQRRHCDDRRAGRAAAGRGRRRGQGARVAQVRAAQPRPRPGAPCAHGPAGRMPPVPAPGAFTGARCAHAGVVPAQRGKGGSPAEAKARKGRGRSAAATPTPAVRVPRPGCRAPPTRASPGALFASHRSRLAGFPVGWRGRCHAVPAAAPLALGPEPTGPEGRRRRRPTARMPPRRPSRPPSPPSSPPRRPRSPASPPSAPPRRPRQAAPPRPPRSRSPCPTAARRRSPARPPRRRRPPPPRRPGPPRGPRRRPRRSRGSRGPRRRRRAPARPASPWCRTRPWSASCRCCAPRPGALLRVMLSGERGAASAPGPGPPAGRLQVSPRAHGRAPHALTGPARRCWRPSC